MKSGLMKSTFFYEHRRDENCLIDHICPILIRNPLRIGTIVPKANRCTRQIAFESENAKNRIYNTAINFA